jgi:hypothetical protein
MLAIVLVVAGAMGVAASRSPEIAVAVGVAAAVGALLVQIFSWYDGDDDGEGASPASGDVLDGSQ